MVFVCPFVGFNTWLMDALVNTLRASLIPFSTLMLSSTSSKWPTKIKPESHPVEQDETENHTLPNYTHAHTLCFHLPPTDTHMYTTYKHNVSNIKTYPISLGFQTRSTVSIWITWFPWWLAVKCTSCFQTVGTFKFRVEWSLLRACEKTTFNGLREKWKNKTKTIEAEVQHSLGWTRWYSGLI